MPHNTAEEIGEGENRAHVLAFNSTGIGRAAVARWRESLELFIRPRMAIDLRSDFDANIAPGIRDVTGRTSVKAAAEAVSSLRNHGHIGSAKLEQDFTAAI